MSKIRAGILSASSPIAPFDVTTYIGQAIVDTNFTDLTSTPEGWVVESGIEDYQYGGLTQGDADPLELTADISAWNVTDVPGWLLIIVNYPDLANVNVAAITENLAQTRNMAITYAGGGVGFADISVYRLEADNSMFCPTFSVHQEQIDNPIANRVFLGAKAFLTVGGGQVMEAVYNIETDPDLNSFGIVSGDFCSDFDPDEVNKIRLTINSGVAGSAFIERILFWDHIPNNNTDVEAVLAIVSAPQPPLDDGEVLLRSMTAWWDAASYSGSGDLINKGTETGLDLVLGASTAAPTFVDGTFVFDGVDDYLTIADNVLLDVATGTDFSVGIIFTLDAPPNSGGSLIYKWEGGGGYFINVSGTTNHATGRYTVLGGNQSFATSPDLDAYDVRTMFTLVKSGGTAQLFANEIGGTAGASIEGEVSNSQPLRIGTSSTGTTPQHFAMHCAFFANFALTSADLADICAHYSVP